MNTCIVNPNGGERKIRKKKKRERKIKWKKRGELRETVLRLVSLLMVGKKSFKSVEGAGSVLKKEK